MPDTRNDGFFYLLYKFFKGLFELVLSSFEILKDYLLYVFDYILNEKRDTNKYIFFKYFFSFIAGILIPLIIALLLSYYGYFRLIDIYKNALKILLVIITLAIITYLTKISLLTIILLTIFSLLFYLIYYVNPFKLFNPQTSQLSVIIIASLFLTLFYFIAYRNESTNHYYAKSSIKNTISNQKEKNEYARKYEFNEDNYKFSFKNPLINLFKSFFSLLGIVLIPVILISLIFSAYHNYHSLFTITKLILGIFIIITTLSIFAYIVNMQLNDINCLDKKIDMFYKLICIIKYLIFFIPCLLIIGIEKLKEDLKLTPKSIYLLFILELVLICLFFFIPVLFKYFANLNKHNLLENNQIYYTHKYRHIAYYQSLRDQNIKSVKDESTSISLFNKDDDPDWNLETKFNGTDNPNKNRVNYTYSISFYLYLNPQEKNTNEAYSDPNGVVLFNYGNKPVIKYYGLTKQLTVESMEKSNNDNGQRITIFKSNDKEYNNYNLKYQKWLYFVINFKDNNLDIFIDGKLVGSKPNIPNFVTNDNVEIGDKNYKNKNGIYGSIKEINYYKTPRPNNNIEFLYDLTKNE